MEVTLSKGDLWGNVASRVSPRWFPQGCGFWQGSTVPGSFCSILLTFTVSLSFRHHPQNSSQTEQETSLLCLVWGSPNTWRKPPGPCLYPGTLVLLPISRVVSPVAVKLTRALRVYANLLRNLRWSRPPRPYNTFKVTQSPWFEACLWKTSVRWASSLHPTFRLRKMVAKG